MKTGMNSPPGLPSKEECVTFNQWAAHYRELPKNKRSLERDEQHIAHLSRFYASMILEDVSKRPQH